MSTGHGWEGLRQVYVRRCLVRAMYNLSAYAVAVSTWGAIRRVFDLRRRVASVNKWFNAKAKNLGLT